MAKNNLTPQQDLITRQFLTEVATAENILPDTPGLRRQLYAILLTMLNYDRLTDGRFITKGKKVTYPYMGMPSLEEYPDEWEADYVRTLKALKIYGDEVSYEVDVKNPDKADSGKPTKNTSVWKALFSKDV